MSNYSLSELSEQSEQSEQSELSEQSPEPLQANFSYYLKQSGLFEKITPHTIRHTIATHWLENGMDLKTIQLLFKELRKDEAGFSFMHQNRN